MFPRMTKLFSENHFFPVGFTNMPAPRNEIYWKGIKMLTCDFATGMLPGVLGYLKTYLFTP